MKRCWPILLCVMLFLGISCETSVQQHTVKGEKKGITIHRYDKLLEDFLHSGSLSSSQKLTMDYRRQTQILIENILEISSVERDSVLRQLHDFYSDTTLVRLREDVARQFTNMEDVEKELTKGFQRLQKEIPNIPIPFIYSQVSAFNESIIVIDTLLGISLDKYMGVDYPLYKRFYYSYQRNTMRRDRIAPDCLFYYLISRYPIVFVDGTCLADIMLYSGKIYYAIQQLLRYDNFGTAIGYSPEEHRWCEEHEKDILNFMQANNHLHARDPMIIRQYMKPSLHKDEEGKQVPTLIGIWLGTKIVSTYMDKHKDVSLKELLEDSDYHHILEEVGYDLQ